MALQWSLSTSSSSRRRRSSVAITPLCCFVSSQIAGHGWKLEWVQEWFWVESCSNKVHGRLPDCCNPTSTWPADQQFYPRVLSDIGPQPPPPLSYCDTLKKETADCGAVYTATTGSSQLQPKVADLRGTHAMAWWVVNIGLEGGGVSSCVSQESAPVFCISGRLCVCARVFVCGTQ